MSAIKKWDRALVRSWCWDRESKPLTSKQQWDKRKLRRAARQLITRAAFPDTCYRNFARWYKR